IGFNASAVLLSAGKSRFRNPTIARDPMLAIAPLRVGNIFPGRLKSLSYRFPPLNPVTADLISGHGFENTIVMHERHQGVDVMIVPCLGKGLKRLDSYRVTHFAFSCFNMSIKDRRSLPDGLGPVSELR